MAGISASGVYRGVEDNFKSWWHPIPKVPANKVDSCALSKTLYVSACKIIDLIGRPVPVGTASGWCFTRRQGSDWMFTSIPLARRIRVVDLEALGR